MNEGGSIAQFFFNILPGGIFIIVCELIFGFGFLGFIKENAVIGLTLFLILSLSFGYIFQVLIIFLRQEVGWNYWAIREVLNHRVTGAHDKENLKRIYKRVMMHSYKEATFRESEAVGLFYLMDCFLRGESKAFLPTHFSSIFAFWSNMLCVALISFWFILIKLFYKKLLPNLTDSDLVLVNAILLTITMISIVFVLSFFTHKFLKSYYSSVLNSFYAKKKL